MSVLLLLLIIGLVVAVFAATAETAITSTNRLVLRSLAEDGDRRAKRTLKLLDRPNEYLSTILTINTFAVIVASSSETVLVLKYLRSVPDFVGTIVLTLFVLTFCEIAPKSVALRFNLRITLFIARPVDFLTTVLRPFVGILTAVGTLFVRFATKGNDVKGPFITEEQLKALVEVGEQEGIVQEEERAMIHGILEMTDKTVRECMVPRIDVVGIESDRSVKDVIALILEHGHSRIPIYEDTIDNVVGVVYAKDLLQNDVRQGGKHTLKEIARQPYFTPDSKHVGELLHEMQVRSVHIAIVVDEYGGMGGIITIEDVIEEIVGPIRDEYDTAEVEDLRFVSEFEVLVNPRMAIDELSEELVIDIGDVDQDSIGGFVYATLGEIPKVGDTVSVQDATIHVDEVRRQSIERLRITSEFPLKRERTVHIEEELEGVHPEIRPKSEAVHSETTDVEDVEAERAADDAGG